MGRYSLERASEQPQEVVAQTGEEAWHPKDREPEVSYRESIERLSEVLEIVAQRLSEAGITNEQETRDWLESRGIVNRGPLPIQDMATDRLLVRMLPPGSVELNKVHVRFEKSLRAFDKVIRNKSDKKREVRDRALLPLYLEAQLRKAIAADDLARTEMVPSASDPQINFSPETRIALAIDADTVIQTLHLYARRKHGNRAPENWRIYLGHDQPELSSRDSYLLIEAVVQTAGGQNPKALQIFWNQGKGDVTPKRQKWGDELRKEIIHEITDLQRAVEYLETVSDALVPDKRAPVARSPQQIQVVVDDMNTSFPYQVTKKEKYGEVDYSHPIMFAKTKAQRDVKIQGGDTTHGQTYFRGDAPPTHWQAAQLEGLPSSKGIPYRGLPQRNVAAFRILGPLFDIVPVTALGKLRDKEVNLLAQEWIPGLEEFDDPNKCARGELALALVAEYIVYERDRNKGNRLVDPKTGKVYLPDKDYTFQKKLDSESLDAPVFYYGMIPLPGYSNVKIETLTDSDLQEIEKKLREKGISKSEISDRLGRIKIAREVVNTYGVPLPKYAQARLKSLSDREIGKIGEDLRQQKLLSEEEITAALNRLRIMRDLVNRYGGYLPKITLDNGRVWDYLAEPEMFNPGPAQLQYIISIYEQQRLAQASAAA